MVSRAGWFAVVGLSMTVAATAAAHVLSEPTRAPSAVVTSLSPLAQTKARGKTFTVERAYGHEHVTEVPPPVVPADATDPWTGGTVVPPVRTWAPIDSTDPWTGAAIHVAPSTHPAADAADPWR